MKLIYKTLLLPTLVLLLACLATELCAQPISGRIISDVDIFAGEEQTEVHINFNFPVRYLRHFPEKTGEELRIQLRPIAVSPDDREALFQRESFVPNEHNQANLSEVIYEGDSFSGLFLTLYFNDVETYQVKQGADYRSLTIIVTRTGTEGATDD
jgi:hypothetical protein